MVNCQVDTELIHDDTANRAGPKVDDDYWFTTDNCVDYPSIVTNDTSKSA